MQIVINLNGAFARRLAILSVICFAVAAGAVPVVVWGTTTVPHIFKNGDVADADQVNANFDALKVGLNDHEGTLQGVLARADSTDSKLVTIEAAIDALSKKPPSNFDALYVNEGQANSITTAMLVDGAVTEKKLAFDVATQAELDTEANELSAISSSIAALQERVNALENRNVSGEVVFWGTHFNARMVADATVAKKYWVQFEPADPEVGFVPYLGGMTTGGISFTTKEAGRLLVMWDGSSCNIDPLHCVIDGSESGLVFNPSASLLYKGALSEIPPGLHSMSFYVFSNEDLTGCRFSEMKFLQLQIITPH